MNRNKKHKGYLILFLALVLVSITAGAAAYRWYAQSDTTNIITTAAIGGEIIDHFEQGTVTYPGATIKKEVGVKNTGEIDCLARVQTRAVWGDERINGVLQENDMPADNIRIAYNENDWVYIEKEQEGWYYYKGILEPEEETAYLFESFTIDPDTEIEYANMHADIRIRMQVIQAGGNGAAAWKVSLKDDLNTTYDQNIAAVQPTTVEFQGPESRFSFTGAAGSASEGDLFAGFKDLIPGETRSQQVEVSSSWEDDVKIYLKARWNAQEQATEDTRQLIDDLLKKYVNLTVTNTKTGQVLYSGKIWGALDAQDGSPASMKDWIALGTYGDNTETLTLTLEVDSQMNNDFQKLEGRIDWIFAAWEVYEPDEPREPQKVVADTSETKAGDTAQPGSLITYEVHYYNHEADTATVQIWDQLDPNVSFRSADNKGDYNEVSHTVSWIIEDVEPLTEGCVSITVEVLGGALATADKKVVNDAEVQIGGNNKQKTKPVEHPVEAIPEPEDPIKTIVADSGLKVNDQVKAGDEITYEIRYYNHESKPVKVIVTDELDAGVDFVNAFPEGIWEYDKKSHVVTWTIEKAEAGTYGRVGLTVEVNEEAAEAGLVENEAWVKIGDNDKVKTDKIKNPVKETSEPDPDPDPEPNPKPDDPREPTKTVADTSEVAAGETAQPGNLITYEIRYYNHEAAEADVQIWDELDPNVAFHSADNKGAYEKEKHTVSWLIEDVKPLTEGSVSVTVEVLPEALNVGKNKVVNDAEVQIGGNSRQKTGPVEHPVDENPNPEDPVKNIAADSGLKEEDPVKVGDEINYEIRYYNHESSALKVVITDELDPGVDFVSASPEGAWEYDETSRTVTWTIENAKARTYGRVGLTVIVKEDAEEAELVTNEAWVKIGNNNKIKTAKIKNPVEETPGPDPDPDPTPEPEEPREPEKIVAKTSEVGTGETVQPGKLITYEIRYYNHEEDSAAVQIWDTLDANVKFYAADNKGKYDAKSHTVSWVIEEVKSMSEGSVNVTVEVLPDALNAIDKKVSNTADVQIGDNDRQKTKPVVHPVEEQPEPEDPVKSILADSGIAENKLVKIGDEISYDIRYYNHETEAAEVVITDALDKGVDFISASPEGTWKYDPSGHTVTWNIEAAQARFHGRVGLTVKVNEDAEADWLVENEADVKIGNNSKTKTNKIKNPVEETSEPDPGPQPVDDEAESPVKSVAADSETGAGETVGAGDQITYEIAYYNHKKETAAVTITDRLDKGVKFVEAGDYAIYDTEDHMVTWNIPDAAAKSRGVVSITVEVTEDAAISVENSADVQIANDPEMSTNIVEHPVDHGTEDPEDSVPVDPDKDTAREGDVLEKDTVKAGDTITYRIRYYNHEREAADIVVTDPLHEGVDFVSADNGGVYDASAHTVTWNIKHAAPETYGRLVLTVQVNERAVKQVENTAVVRIGSNEQQMTGVVIHPVVEDGGQPETKEPETEAPELVEPGTDEPGTKDPNVGVGSNVTGSSDTFRKTPLSKEAAPGQTVDYVFTGFGNTLDRSMKRFSVTDIFPEGLIFESAQVPAFTKGEGLTYRITYITNFHGKRTLYEDIPADTSFTFDAPKLENGERITYLTVVFEEVPVGFGRDDSILFTCRVADDVTTKELVNEAALSYDGIGLAGEVKEIKITDSAATGRNPKTADEYHMLPYIISLFSAFIVVLVAAGRVQRRNKRR